MPIVFTSNVVELNVHRERQDGADGNEDQTDSESHGPSV